MIASLTLMGTDLIVLGSLLAVALVLFVLSRLTRLTKANERIADHLDRIEQQQPPK